MPAAGPFACTLRLLAGAVAWVLSEVSMAGETTFEHNTALTRGGKSDHEGQ